MRLILGVFLLSMHMAVMAAPDGEALFSSHCAACHGSQGLGGVGVPLALPSFLDSVDDRFLVTSIRYGRPGRVMPAFSALSDAQVNAIVSFMRGWSEQPAPVYAATPVSGDKQHGKELFAAHCAACHGAGGEGGKGTGVTLSRHRDQPIIAPALANRGFLQAASDEMIKHTLKYGREGTPMRSFLEQGLSEQDINDLVSYVRSFEDLDGVRAAHGNNELPSITVESPYSMEETVENLKQAIISQNFLLIRTDTLEHGLVEHDQENQKQKILHFCNFKFLFDALAVDPRVGMFLPCRVTVTEQDGKVKISVINPLYLSHLFNNAELDEYCKRMRAVYLGILEEATL
jgi:cytochrome c oxidase cbb3-type subunit 3